MKTINKHSYNYMESKLTVDGTDYIVVSVVDHLEDIMKATTGALADYTRGKAVALDFSAIRPRGSKTSHAGVATGPASFAKAFADLIHVMSNVDDDVRVKPIAIVLDSHPDFVEYSELVSKEVVFLSRNADWSDIKDVHGFQKPIPNWELTSTELNEVNSERSRRASPWYKDI